MDIRHVTFSDLTGLNLTDNYDDDWGDEQNSLFKSFDENMSSLDEQENFHYAYHDCTEIDRIDGPICLPFLRFVARMSPKYKMCLICSIQYPWRRTHEGDTLSMALACDSLEEAKGMISAYMVHGT